jgi:hypothetical protein
MLHRGLLQNSILSQELFPDPFLLADNNPISKYDRLGLCAPDPNSECWKKFSELSSEQQWNYTCCGGNLKLKYEHMFSSDNIRQMESDGTITPGSCVGDEWIPGTHGDKYVEPPAELGVGVMGAAGVVSAELGTSGSSVGLTQKNLTAGMGFVSGLTASMGYSDGYGVCCSGGIGAGLGIGFSLTISEGGTSGTLYLGPGTGAFGGFGPSRTGTD